MEIRLVIFLAFASVTVISNTLIIFLAYRLFAQMTSKVTETVTEVQNNTEAREWIASLQVAAERAAALTESTKLKMAEFDPILNRAQENYRRTLATIDSKLDETAEQINSSVRDVRDVVAKPAFAVATFAAGVTRVLAGQEDGED